MNTPTKYPLRYVLGFVLIIMMGALMYSETVETAVGISVVIGVAAALGLYEGGARKGGK